MTPPRAILAGCLLAAVFGGTALHYADQGEGASMEAHEREAIDAAVDAATADVAHAARAACSAALERSRAQEEALGEVGEADCSVALAALPDADAHSLAAEVIEKSRGPLALTLALEDAALRNDAASWLTAAAHLRSAAGPEETDFAQLDPHALSAAIAAARRAAAMDPSAGAPLVRTLEDIEFPLRGAPEEALWRALYFGRFAEIRDSIPVRHRVAGMAYALSDLCRQWEPPGIGSVEFETGLQTYLAPLRAQVPARIASALPKAGSALFQAYAESRSEAGGSSVEDILTAGYRAFSAAAKPLQDSVALGSVSGRDAAQMLFNEVQSCRSPRGGRFIRNLTRYFRQTGSPSAAVPGTAAAEPSTMEH